MAYFDELLQIIKYLSCQPNKQSNQSTEKNGDRLI